MVVGKKELARVKLDDRLHVDRHFMRLKRGGLHYFPGMQVNAFKPCGKSFIRETFLKSHKHRLPPFTFFHGNHVTGFDGIRRHVNAPAVHREQPVTDKLAGVGTGSAVPETIHDIIETRFQPLDEGLRRHPAFAKSFLIVFLQLSFPESIHRTERLFLTELATKVGAAIGRRRASAALSVHSRRVWTSHHWTFGRETFLPFQEEFFARPTAATANTIKRVWHGRKS
jgi:hypothetical protein